jgi:hypothetical protein
MGTEKIEPSIASRRTLTEQSVDPTDSKHKQQGITSTHLLRFIE